MGSKAFLLAFVATTAHCNEPVVESGLGKITGITEVFEGQSVDGFLGIPFAKPPVGQLRFDYPVAFGPVGTLEAKQVSRKCVQTKIFGPPGEFDHGSEDCLYLNIYRRSGTSEGDGKNVIVSIHGGAFCAGSGSEREAATIATVATHDFIVVTINYRLGILGFADMKELAPGNLGLWDQRLALEWVQQNIRDFGGNPDKVTLSGVSAGSMSLSAQIMSLVNRGRKLFHAAIMDAGVSLYGTNTQCPEKSLQRVKHVAEKMNCPTEDQAMLKCLREADPFELTAAAHEPETHSPIFPFLPTSDGKFLPRDMATELRENAGDLADVKLLIGYAKDEGTLFAGYEIMNLKVPDFQSSDEFLAYLGKLARGYHYKIDMEDKEIRRKLVETYYKKSSSFFNDSASFLREGTFSCGVNAFAKNYAKNHENVYFYDFQRLISGESKIFNKDILGVTHVVPYSYMTGAIYADAFFLPGFAVTQDDKEFSKDMMQVMADFIKNDGAPTLRGVKLPNLSKGEGVITINDTPLISKQLPHEEACNSLFSYIEGSGKMQKTEL